MWPTSAPRTRAPALPQDPGAGPCHPGDMGRARRHPARAVQVWDNGDLPIWMTFDAIEALRLANLAVPAHPAWSSP